MTDDQYAEPDREEVSRAVLDKFQVHESDIHDAVRQASDPKLYTAVPSLLAHHVHAANSIRTCMYMYSVYILLNFWLYRY